MDGIYLVAATLAAIEALDLETTAIQLADDFVFNGSGYKLNKQRFIALQSVVCTALPDFAFNTIRIRQTDHKVCATVRITGTHLHDLELGVLGLPTVPATGIFCELPQEQVEFVIQDNQITQINASHGPHGGVPGILEQLGVDLRKPR